MKRRLIPVLLICASSCATSGDSTRDDHCLEKLAAEQRSAVKEGRPAVPVIEKAKLLTDVLDPQNRAEITFAMLREAKEPDVAMLAEIYVTSGGSVSKVEVLRSSGVAAFDKAVTEKMKTWKYAPATLNCKRIPSDYPFQYRHRFAK